MATVAANGISVHVEQMPAAARRTPPGVARTVVFLHGIGTDSLASYYFTLAKPFADVGLHVVMYDLRGHGRSDRPATGYTLADFVADLAALLTTLGLADPVYLVGNSFGGTVAFSFAQRYPERVAGIAVIESEPATPAWATKMAANLARAAEELRRPEALAWITVRYGRHTSRLAKAAGKLLNATSVARDIPDSQVLSVAQLQAIRCPVLAMYGAKSDLAAQAPVLGRTLPNCSTVIIPGQEHSVLVEMPMKVRALVLDWLAEHPRLGMVGAEER